MINRYDKGDLARVSIEFTDLAGALVDPATVKFSFRKPGSAPVTYIYGTDSQLVKDSAGKFHVDVACDVVGRFHYRWESTGSGQAAEEGEFVVANSRFD